MTEIIYYEKRGRRYVPVKWYDNHLMDSFPKGAHLVVCEPGRTTRRYHIDPNFAAMIAAGMYAHESMVSAIKEASKLKETGSRSDPLTPAQRAAWNNFAKEMGEDIYAISWDSAAKIAMAGLEALHKEAEKLLENPSARKAFDQFLMICELTKNEQT